MRDGTAKMIHLLVALPRRYRYKLVNYPLEQHADVLKYSILRIRSCELATRNQMKVSTRMTVQGKTSTRGRVACASDSPLSRYAIGKRWWRGMADSSNSRASSSSTTTPYTPLNTVSAARAHEIATRDDLKLVPLFWQLRCKYTIKLVIHSLDRADPMRNTENMRCE